MCTVTYIPLKDGFVLTSSRDEKVQRPTLKPKAYLHHKALLVYPKDEIANGTWIAASNKNRIACLLNGAFQNHEKKDYYTKSRGQVLIDCFEYNSFEVALENLDLAGVEPFTLLLIDYSNEIVFYQLVWDGVRKHIQSKPNHVPQIWSSATLYSQQNRETRKSWFDNWIENHKDNIDFDILSFHTTKHSDIESNEIVMKRENDLQTVSVTQIILNAQYESFSYHDLVDASKTILNLSELVCTQE